MKTLSLVFLTASLFFFPSCSSKKQSSADKITLQYTDIENGKGTIVILKNKSLAIASTEMGLTYRINPNTSSDIIHYNYEKNMDQVQIDGGYREELIFEIPSGDFELSLTDNELQKTKMIYGRHCFCRGQNGLFKITKGALKITRKKGKLKFVATYHQDKVPQVIAEIQY